MVGVWSLEPEYRPWRAGGWGGDRLRFPNPTPTPSHVALCQKRTERQCLWPSHMERLQMLQLCECCQRDSEFLPVPERPFRAPLCCGWVGLSSWLPWRTRLTGVTDLFQNIWCWVAVKYQLGSWAKPSSSSS